MKKPGSGGEATGQGIPIPQARQSGHDGGMDWIGSSMNNMQIKRDSEGHLKGGDQGTSAMGVKGVKGAGGQDASRARVLEFLQRHTAYELIPESAKVVVLDTKLPVRKAFHACYEQGITAAPLWDEHQQEFVEMLSTGDFIDVLVGVASGGMDGPGPMTVRRDGDLYVTSHHTGDVMRYDPMAAPGSRWQTVGLGFGGISVHGIAADAEGWVWGGAWTNGVVRIDADSPTPWQGVAGTNGHANKGMAVDSDGKIWSIIQGDRAIVITPGPTIAEASVNADVARTIVSPYTYSDMLGMALRTITHRSESFSFWRGVIDSGVDDPVWEDVGWNAYEPSATDLQVRARCSSERGAPGSDRSTSVG